MVVSQDVPLQSLHQHTPLMGPFPNGSVLARLASPFREFGWFAGLLYALQRVLPRVSPHLGLRFFEFMVLPITDQPLLAPHRAANLEFREIRRGDPEVALMPARPEIKESRFDQGAVCVGAFRKGQLIGYIWFCFHTYEEDEARCTYVLPGREAAFDFDLYLFPEHRMGLAFAGLWHGGSAFLRNRGVRWSFSRLTVFNTASRRAHDRLGQKALGRAVFLRAWRSELMLASVAPYVHLSLGPSDRVRLALRADIPARESRKPD
jgi:hypothetical protein